MATVSSVPIVVPGINRKRLYGLKRFELRPGRRKQRRPRATEWREEIGVMIDPNCVIPHSRLAER